MRKARRGEAIAPVQPRWTSGRFRSYRRRLIDNRGGVVRKRPAFHGFATLCRLFNGARIERFSRQDELGHFRLAARKDGMEILALGNSPICRIWSNGEIEVSVPAKIRKRHTANGILKDAGIDAKV